MLHYKLRFILISALFFIQLCSIKHYSTYTQNFLIIYFTYTLFYRFSIFNSTVSLFYIELISFIQTRIIGLSTTCLIPLSYILLPIKTKLQAKWIIYCLFIGIYYLYHNSLLYFKLAYPVHITSVVFQIIINSFITILLDLIINLTQKKEPL